MKETKVYVDELSKSCEKCPLGYFYDCQYCFLRPDLAEKHEWCEKDKHCPLIDIKTHDRELVKEVCDEIKNKLGSIEDILINLGNGKEDALSYFMYILNKIQKEFEK